MMGERQLRQDALFYEFSLERHVPEGHLLRSIDRFVELDGLRQSQHADNTFSRDDLPYNHKRDCYICPAGNKLRQRQKDLSSAAPPSSIATA
jgi:hypothetical protein